jgi:hypothetical protein
MRRSPSRTDRSAVWVLGITLAAAGCGGAGATTGKEAGVLEVHADGTARLVGAATENDKGCTVDAVCRLIVDAGNCRVVVVYHGGEAVPCVNSEAIRQGFAVEPGDRVEAYGAYEESGAGPSLSTCPAERYYIRRTK